MKIATEMNMGNNFQNLLENKDGIKEFPNFKAVFRELNCKQGIPDFIAITELHSYIFQKNIYDTVGGSLDSSSLIISLLKPKSPRTFKYIVDKTGLSTITVKKVLKDLIVNKIICKTEKGLFVLNKEWELPKVELWAFELKLKDWKRALFQCLQYKAFANRVMLVMPEDKENLITKNIDIIKKYQIGIMLFDTDNFNYKIIAKPPKLIPNSRSHNIYAVGKITNELNSIK